MLRVGNVEVSAGGDMHVAVGDGESAGSFSWKKGIEARWRRTKGATGERGCCVERRTCHPTITTNKWEGIRELASAEFAAVFGRCRSEIGEAGCVRDNDAAVEEEAVRRFVGGLSGGIIVRDEKRENRFDAFREHRHIEDVHRFDIRVGVVDGHEFAGVLVHHFENRPEDGLAEVFGDGYDLRTEEDDGNQWAAREEGDQKLTRRISCIFGGIHQRVSVALYWVATHLEGSRVFGKGRGIRK